MYAKDKSDLTTIIRLASHSNHTILGVTKN